MLKLTFSIILLWPGVKEGIGRKEGEGTGRKEGEGTGRKEGEGRKGKEGKRGWKKRCHFNGNNSSIKTKKYPLSRRLLQSVYIILCHLIPQGVGGWGGQ